MNTSLLCNNCNTKFASRSSYRYHTKNKVCEKQQQYKCRYCHRGFAHSSSMYRHENNICTERKMDDDLENDENDDAFDNDIDKVELLRMFRKMQKQVSQIPELRAQIDILRTENGKLKTNTMINNGTITNNNIHGNMINNYVLVGYGKEDLDRIDRNDLLKGIRSGFNSTYNLIDAVHFNPKYPEFHNVYISSMKNKYAMMYDGNDWTLVMKDDLIDKLYDDKRNYIEENLEDFLESLTTSQKNALDRWMNAKDDHPYIQKIKNDIKLLLYNKRKMVTNPGSIEYLETEERVIKKPKGNIIDPPFKVDKSSKKVDMIKEKRQNAVRPGTKRKIAHIKRTSKN